MGTTRSNWPVLLVIDTKTKECQRFAGRSNTHNFRVETDITPEKIDTMRRQPDGAGQPEEAA